LETPVAPSVGSQAAPAKSTIKVATQTLRRRPSTMLATLFENLCELPDAEIFGVRGQTAARPRKNSSAGNRVNAATHAKKMPVAAIGPKDWFELRSETNKHSSAMATVAADAVMAPKEAFHEAFKESATDSVCCNSSLWRATRSSE